MKRLMKIAAAFALLLGTNAVFAQVSYYDGPGADNGTEDNTDSGTEVENIVTVTYDVNGVAQTAVDNTDLAGDGLIFTVDRAILFTVSSVADDSVEPGQTGQPLEFTITNDSNDVLDFVLSPTNVGTGDDFQVDNLAIYQDDGGTVGSFDGTDTLLPANRITNLAEGATVTVFVVSDVPSAAFSNGDTADVVLMATAYNTSGEGGGIVTETNVGATDDPTIEDTVFGDPDGTFDDGLGNPDSADVAEDGRDSDTGTYTITTASIAVTKSSTVISDPFNGVGDGSTIFPKAIPGAVVEYCILVTNTGNTAATNVAVSDPIPSFTTYVAGSIEIAADCAGTGAIAEDDDTDDNTPAAGDETGAAGSFNAGAGANGTVSTTVDTLADGDPTPTTTATIFRVTID